MKFESKQQYFFMQRKYEEFLKQVCPDLQHRAGIYFYTRIEEDERLAYIGKSIDCLKRCISHHLGRKQPIDLSIHKRGYYDKTNNEMGWKLNVLYFNPSELDEKERHYIEMYKNAGYTLYNIESGGTVGKTMIAERQEPKGYRDGIDYAKKKTLKEIKVYFEKYLDAVIKGKPNKIKERKLKEFMELIYGETETISGETED